MAKYEEPKITVSLDDETKYLIRALVRAVDRIAPPEAADVSFADAPKRLVEKHVGQVEYGGRKYQLIMEGEGDYLLHDDGHEGDELE